MAGVLTVVVVIIVILLILALLGAMTNSGGSGRRRRRDNVIQELLLGEDVSHDDKHANKVSGDRPHPPREVCCESDDLFTLDVKWKASASKNVDHYQVYLKFLDCDDDSDSGSGSGSGSRSNSRSGSRSGSRGSTNTNTFSGPPQARNLVNCSGNRGCGCNKCSESSSSSSSGSCSSSSSSSSESCPEPTCECGPHNFDRIVKVPACDTRVLIRDIKEKKVCVTVTAVSECGRESYTGNCCTSKIDCRVKIFPCVVKSTNCKLNLRWDKISCHADKHSCILIFYDGELMFELPGDAEGVRKLPPIEDTNIKVEVAVKTKCGTGKKYEISKACPCKGPDCGDCQPCREKRVKKHCHKCRKDEDSCGCKGKRSSPRFNSDSRSNSRSRGSRSNSNTRSN